MKKIILICTPILILLVSISIYLINNTNKDGKRFSKEYSYLNLSNKNPFIYKNAKEIITMINDDESFLVYFGYPDSVAVKENISNMIKAINDTNTSLIYYVNTKNIKDTKEIINDRVETTKLGTSGYYDLVMFLYDYLDDYYVDNSLVGKRITEPTLLAISNGKVSSITKNDYSYESFLEVIRSLNGLNICDEDKAC